MELGSLDKTPFFGIYTFYGRVSEGTELCVTSMQIYVVTRYWEWKTTKRETVPEEYSRMYPQHGFAR
eukprot:5751864-Amphidinium_carterae.1